jgi:hypothetical protein
MQTIGETTHAPANGARPSVGLRVLLGMGALLLFALLVARVHHVLGPHTPAVSGFNSDNAVPVMMCNAREWNPFHFYYYGQDRFGAWPFLSARVVGQLLGAPVLPEHLHVWLTTWLLAGAFVMGALVPKGLRLLASGLYVAVLLAIPSLRFILFELAQVYPWQLTALLLAWWSLRRHHDALAAALAPSPRAVRWGRARTVLLAFLAIWSSSTSGPLLGLVAAVEALRIRLLAPKRYPGWRALRRLGEGVVLVGVAVLLETLARSGYHRYAKLHYGYRYRTNVGIDFPFLGENARAVLGRLWEYDALPLLVVGTVGALVATVFLLRLLRARAPGEPLLVEGAVLLLGTWVLAAAHVPLLTLVNHVRLNGYEPRYFVPLFLFGAFAGALTLALAATRVPGLARVRPRVLAAMGVLALAGGAWALPAPQLSPEYAELKRTAERLAQRMPGAPVLGGYWHTYVWPGLQPQGALLPIPREGDYQRTVWFARALKRQPRALVEHSDFPEAGSPEAPAPWLFQYDTLLRLEQPRWDTGAGRTFSVYRNVLPQALPITPEPALAAWKPCAPDASLTLTFAPRAQAQLFVALGGTDFPVALTAQPLVEGPGPAPAPVPLQAHGRLHHATLAGGGAPLRGVRLGATPSQAGTGKEGVCRGEALLVLDGTVDSTPQP